MKTRPILFSAPMIRALCWWFGCVPDHHNAEYHYDSVAETWDGATPCERCGAHDVSYGDMVGDTRHNRFVDWCKFWLFRRWWPVPCRDCGKRFGDHSKCDALPF